MFDPSSETYRAWHLTGTGFDNLRAVTLPRPKIAPDELLLWQRVVTICYSSVKVLRLGNSHPRLVGRDLAKDPVVLGDECFGVVVEVGGNLRGRFAVGDEVAVSPDLDVDAYGYGVPGALQQLNVIRGKMLDFLMKVPKGSAATFGMFALPLSEPLGCVERALSLTYRTSPADDDVIIQSDDPAVIARRAAEVLPGLAKFGVLAILGDPPADCTIDIDLGQVHYDRTLVVGSDGADLADAFTRNTSFGLRKGSTVLLLGAGGPMGQFFLMRCVSERNQPPARVLAAEIRPDRVANLERVTSRLDTDVDVRVLDVSREPTRVAADVTDVDMVVLLCDDIEALKGYLPALNDGAVVNVFAGLKGAVLNVPARDICRRGIRVVGHSGVNLKYQTITLERITSGEVDVAPVVAAVCGFDAARDALRAARDGTYPGKMVVYLDVDAPLVPVRTLARDALWSAEAERTFLTQHDKEDRHSCLS